MSETSSYFDTHIDCFGYLKNIRDVPFGKGKNAGTFIACTIGGLQGQKDEPDYCTFQAKVTGRDAAKLINDSRDAVKRSKRGLLVKVRLSDPWIDQFTYPQDHEKAGQPGASLKTRLLFIKRINDSEIPSDLSIDINCFGYLNSIRDVPSGTGESADTFVACSIAALQGPKEKPDYCYFQAKVTEPAALHLINRCRSAVKKKQKVLVGVHLSDPWIDQFTYPPDHKKAGQPGASLKTCLSLIRWIRVDGNRVYLRPKDTSPTQNQEAAPPNQSQVADLHKGEHSDLPAPELPAPADAELADKAA